MGVRVVGWTMAAVKAAARESSSGRAARFWAAGVATSLLPVAGHTLLGRRRAWPQWRAALVAAANCMQFVQTMQHYT